MQVEPERQPKEERAATPPERPPLNGLTFLAVIVLAITGNIVRDLFSAYPPFYYETYLLPNFIGSFVMGLVVGSELASYAPISAVGISVGFCGSVTTFSEWMLAVGAAPAGDVGVIMTITGLCTPFIALLAGSDLGRAGRRRWCPSSTKDGRFGFWMDVVVLTVGVVVALAACLAIAFAWSTERSPIVYAALIGIGGALLRYLLSWWLNFVWLECSTFIPIGTFVCNVIAFIFVSALFPCHYSGSQWCGNLIAGFGGSLSTVSAWAADGFALYNQSHSGNVKGVAYAYVLLTLTVGLVICVPVVQSTIHNWDG
jgi:CrcB protein